MKEISFFAHAAGHAAMLSIIFVLATRNRTRSEIIWVPIVVFLLGWLYPLSQLQVAAGAISLWIIASVHAALLRQQNVKYYIFGSVVITVLSMAAFRFHPTYILMRDVANNNGEIFANLRFSTLTLLAATLFSASCAIAYLAIKERSNLVHPYFLAATGFATSLVFLAHLTVYIITQAGSEYALRKHTYSIATILVIQISCLIARALNGRQQPRHRRWMHASCVAVLISISSFIAIWTALSRKSEDIKTFIALQSNVRKLAFQNPQFFGHSISRISEISNTQNFIITAIDLRRNDEEARRLANGPETKPPDGISFCIVSAPPTPQVIATDCSKMK